MNTNWNEGDPVNTTIMSTTQSGTSVATTSRRRRVASIALLACASLFAAAALTGLSAGPAAAAHKKKAARERHAYGLPAPTSRQAWGGWIGSWKTPDGQLVYHLDPQARRALASYRPAVPAAPLTYRSEPVPGAAQEQAAWILSKYGAVAQPAQDAAVELALDNVLVGGKYGLKGSITKRRLTRLDKTTRAQLLRLAADMVSTAQQQAGPYQVHLTKAGAMTASSTPVSVSVTTAGGFAAPRIPVSVTTSSGTTLSGVTGPDGAAVTLSVPRSSTSATQQITASASVPSLSLFVRTATARGLSRAAVAGARTASTAAATATSPTTWTLTWQQYSQTAPASDTRTYQTRYTGTFQDSWTCKLGSGGSPCQDPAGDYCSHNTTLASGNWDDTSVPPSGYRSGNTCVWRAYTQTGSYTVQTGGSYTPAQYAWVPASSTYADPGQASAAYSSCQKNGLSQRSCSLSDNSAWSAS